MTHFFILFGMIEKWPILNCVSSVLTQNEDIWKIHGSLSLNKGKLIRYSGSLWFAIVLILTYFFHSV